MQYCYCKLLGVYCTLLCCLKNLTFMELYGQRCTHWPSFPATGSESLSVPLANCAKTWQDTRKSQPTSFLWDISRGKGICSPISFRLCYCVLMLNGKLECSQLSHPARLLFICATCTCFVNVITVKGILFQSSVDDTMCPSPFSLP